MRLSAFWSSVAGAIGQAPVGIYFVRLAYGFVADREASTGWLGFGVVVGSTGFSLLLIGLSILFGGNVGFLVSALSVQLLFGLWVFMRLLVLRH